MDPATFSCDAEGCPRTTTDLSSWYEIDVQYPTMTGKRMVVGGECCSWAHVVAFVEATRTADQRPSVRLI
jgi:hypothetical protein